MFNFIKNKVKKLYEGFTAKVESIFSRSSIDEAALKELEALLISADVGFRTTHSILEKLRLALKNNTIEKGEDLKVQLRTLLIELLGVPNHVELVPRVLLLIGINGSGKTTFAARYAHMLKKQGKKVLLVAGDTFRAAATNQLNEWAQRIDVPVFIGKDSQDPASVIFDACARAQREGFEYIIIDTAGRMQTKINLMKELEKIKRIVTKQLPGEHIYSWLTIDAMLGQNSLTQAKLFNEAAQIDGLILTKLDGSAKGGIVFAISGELGLPITYATFGEKPEDITAFDKEKFVEDLLGH